MIPYVLHCVFSWCLPSRKVKNTTYSDSRWLNPSLCLSCSIYTCHRHFKQFWDWVWLYPMTRIDWIHVIKWRKCAAYCKSSGTNQNWAQKTYHQIIVLLKSRDSSIMPQWWFNQMHGRSRFSQDHQQCWGPKVCPRALRIRDKRFLDCGSTFYPWSMWLVEGAHSGPVHCRPLCIGRELISQISAQIFQSKTRSCETWVSWSH